MKKDILVFSHIPKNAGTSIVDLLRSYNGLRHIDVVHRNRQGLHQYGYEEAKSDFRFMPWVTSIAGHYLQPWQDYHEFDSRFFWFVILREPIDRFVSQYAYQVERYGLKQDFAAWKRQYSKHNAQVVHLAGEPDLCAAKEILRDKIDLIGFVDSIEDVAAVLHKWMGMPTGTKFVGIKRKNLSSSQLKNDVLDNMHKYSDIILDCNALDIELYEYALTLYEEKLLEAETVLAERKNVHIRKPTALKRSTNRIFRNIVYKLYARIV